MIVTPKYFKPTEWNENPIISKYFSLVQFEKIKTLMINMKEEDDSRIILEDMLFEFKNCDVAYCTYWGQNHKFVRLDFKDISNENKNIDVYWLLRIETFDNKNFEITESKYELDPNY